MRLKSLLRNMLVATSVLAISAPGIAVAAAAPDTQQVSTQNKPQHSRTRPSKKKKASTETPAQSSAPQSSAAAKQKKNKKNDKKAKPATESVSSNYRAFKINVPYAAFAIQNLAFEWQTSRSMTVDIPVMWSVSDLTDRHGIRTIAIQPEARWWPGANPGNGHFLGANISAGWFNVRWRDTRYQADGLPLLGAGISYGYRLNFTPNWGAEFNIGAGYAYMEYDRFYNIDNGAKIDRCSRHYFGLTRVGVSLVYRF